VVGIIDKNPDNVDTDGLAVRTYTAQDIYEKYGEIFVIIGLMDAVKHFEVAVFLNRLGFSRILFLPLRLRSKASFAMTQCWNSWIDNTYISVPAYDSLWSVNHLDFIMNSFDDYVTVVIHKNHIETLNQNHLTNLDNGNNHTPYAAYRRFNSKYPFPSESRKIFNTPLTEFDYIKQNAEKNLPNTNALSYYKQALFSPVDFYYNSACPAMLNENGRFNLVDGMHRSLMLIEHGLSGIPLKILRESFYEYWSQSEAQKLMNAVKQYGYIVKEVCHPDFVMLPIKEDAEFNCTIPEQFL
jgi:hypothetical protein